MVYSVSDTSAFVISVWERPQTSTLSSKTLSDAQYLSNCSPVHTVSAYGDIQSLTGGV